MIWIFLLLFLSALFVFFDNKTALTTTLTLAVLGAILLFSFHFKVVGVLL